jgi:hypothetical protein
MLMRLRIRRRREIGDLILELIWLVDQDRQALRADVKFPALVGKFEQGIFLFRFAAIETDGHDILQKQNERRLYPESVFIQISTVIARRPQADEAIPKLP